MLKILRILLYNSVNASIFSMLWIATAVSLFCIYQKFLKLRIPFRESAITFVSALFLLLLSYSPLINSYFVYHDDYNFWGMQKGLCHTHPQYIFFFVTGRPIANIVLCPLRSMIDSLDSANLVRFIFIFLTSIVFFIVNRYLIYKGFSKLVAYGISLLVVTNFAFHVYNTWIIASYILVAIIFSIFSIWLAEKSAEEWFRITAQENFNRFSLFSSNYLIFFLISSIIFYILTLLTYQTSSGFFTCFVAISFLKEKRININSLLVKSSIFGGIFAISNALYFLILYTSLLVFPFDQYSNASTYDPRVFGDLSNRIFERIVWFFKIPFVNSFNFINIESKATVIICISLFLLAIFSLLVRDLTSVVSFRSKKRLFFVLYKHLTSFSILALFFKELRSIVLFRNNNKKRLFFILYKYFIVIFCIPLSSISIIVSRNPDINYRTLAPLMVFFLIAIIISIELICEYIFSNIKSASYYKTNIFVLILLASLCSINLFSTNLRLYTLTKAYSSEIRYFKYRINSFPAENIENLKLIKVIVHSNVPSILNNSISELKVYSSAYPQDIVHILTCAFSEVSDGKKPKEPPIVSVYNSSGEQFSGISPSEEAKIGDTNKLFIDMNELTKSQYKR
ncbi:hypothetical protein [Spirulina sp. 06S082]|uniref:hypothetical protein n=1 Tax=Spirulina sp. 06S082 TaxID=3110248 RepID=UPI002B1F1BA0|nr:hypothetical protein [Spirulina sp. 06S082]MEA5468203.1 hypothetical protein [Spirulina sp. 06S082]